MLAGAEREPHVQPDADEAGGNRGIVRGREPQALAEAPRGNASLRGGAPLVVVERAGRERASGRARSLEQRAYGLEIGRGGNNARISTSGQSGVSLGGGLEDRVVGGVAERQRIRARELEQRLRVRDVGGGDAQRESPVAQRPRPGAHLSPSRRSR